MSEILVNDIYDELFEENKRLLFQLVFADQCLKALIKFKAFVDFISTKFKTKFNSNESKKFDKIREEVDDILTTNHSEIEKSLIFEKYRQITDEVLNPIKTSKTKTQITQTDPILLIEDVTPNILTLNYDIKEEPDSSLDNPSKQLEFDPQIDKQIETRVNPLSDPQIDLICEDISDPMNVNVISSEDESYNCDLLDNESDESDVELMPKTSKNQLNGKVFVKQLKIGTKVTTNLSEKHKNAEPFVCAFEGCVYQSFVRNNFNKHMARHPQTFQCSHSGCDYTTTSRLSFRRHMNGHKHQQLVCDFVGCGYRTLRKDHFEDHLARHQGIKAFQCEYDGCGKSFITRKSARSHEREVHESNNKPFVCDFADCGQRFRSKVSLSNHHNKHTSGVECRPIDEEEYVSSHSGCDYKTTSSLKLKRH